MSYFDGDWRLEPEGGKLIDSRELPVEHVIKDDNGEAKEVRRRLLDWVNSE